MTLKQILEKQEKRRNENGDYGITACKESIKQQMEWDNKSLYQLLEEFVERANKDIFFNNAMVLACWEMINE